MICFVLFYGKCSVVSEISKYFGAQSFHHRTFSTTNEVFHFAFSIGQQCTCNTAALEHCWTDDSIFYNVIREFCSMKYLSSFHFRDNYDFPRSWLVPVIRDNVCNTELQFFTKFFLPLAAKFKIKCKLMLTTRPFIFKEICQKH